MHEESADSSKVFTIPPLSQLGNRLGGKKERKKMRLLDSSQIMLGSHHHLLALLPESKVWMSEALLGSHFSQCNVGGCLIFNFRVLLPFIGL